MIENIRQMTRRQLYNLVWKTAVDTLAKDFGMSGRGLGKLCERHGIPVPPRGYWARKASGQKVKRPPLVELSDSERPEIVVDLRFRSSVQTTDTNDPEAAFAPYRELFKRQLGEIRVAVQRLLDDQAAARRSPSNGKQPCLLTGLVFDGH